MRGGLLWLPEHTGTGFKNEWALENITTTFFKCTRWQAEETTDIINCPYHYYCDSTYPGDYPPAVDFVVLFFAAATFVSAVGFLAMEFRRIRGSVSTRSMERRRLFLPSGPIGFPLILLSLTKGYRINTAFPLMHMGPALLILVHVSALAFENQPERHIKYAILEASTISGILHASLYLDSIILPFYTGLEALTKSIFSGECPSCVCMKEALLIGGKLVTYRGWSPTTFFVVSTLCSRMVCRILEEEKMSLLVKMILEGISWALIASDCIYLMIIPEGGAIYKVAFGGIVALIFFSVLRKVSSLLVWMAASSNKDDVIL